MTYKKDQEIEPRGAAPRFVTTIVSGVAALRRHAQDHRSLTTGLLMPSDFHGQLRPGGSAQSLTAVTDTTACRIPMHQFRGLLDTHPPILRRLLQMKRDELDSSRDWILLLGRKTSRERVASLIVDMVWRTRPEHPKHATSSIPLDLSISREELGACVGLAEETVSRELSGLKRDHVIRPVGRRGLLVLNYEALVTEAGDWPEVGDRT